MGVIIVREMVGTSPHSWSDAARQAVALASKTVRNIRYVEVVESTAHVEDGEIKEYRVQLKLGFEYEEQRPAIETAHRGHWPPCPRAAVLALVASGCGRGASCPPRPPQPTAAAEPTALPSARPALTSARTP